MCSWSSIRSNTLPHISISPSLSLSVFQEHAPAASEGMSVNKRHAVCDVCVCAYKGLREGRKRGAPVNNAATPLARALTWQSIWCSRPQFFHTSLDSHCADIQGVKKVITKQRSGMGLIFWATPYFSLEAKPSSHLLQWFPHTPHALSLLFERVEMRLVSYHL